MQVEGDEVDRCPDICLFERFNELISGDGEALEPQLNDIEMPGVLHVGTAYGSCDLRKIGEAVVIGFRNALSFLKKRFALFQLFDSKAGCEVCEIVFISGSED